LRRFEEDSWLNSSAKSEMFLDTFNLLAIDLEEDPLLLLSLDFCLDDIALEFPYKFSELSLVLSSLLFIFECNECKRFYWLSYVILIPLASFLFCLSSILFSLTLLPIISVLYPGKSSLSTKVFSMEG